MDLFFVKKALSNTFYNSLFNDVNLSKEEGSLVYFIIHSISILWDGTVHYSYEAEVGYGSTITDINHNYTS